MATVLKLDVGIDAFAKAIGIATGLATERIARDLHNKIVNRTPVDTGRARASWDAAIGQPSDYVPPEQESPGEPPAFDAGGEIDGTEIVWIVSNLDYIESLENGHSDQAPAGMLAVSLAEVEAEIDTILDGLGPEAEALAQ